MLDTIQTTQHNNTTQQQQQHNTTTTTTTTTELTTNKQYEMLNTNLDIVFEYLLIPLVYLL